MPLVPQPQGTHSDELFDQAEGTEELPPHLFDPLVARTGADARGIC
jgi:hypothetical protein